MIDPKGDMAMVVVNALWGGFLGAFGGFLGGITDGNIWAGLAGGALGGLTGAAFGMILGGVHGGAIGGTIGGAGGGGLTKFLNDPSASTIDKYWAMGKGGSIGLTTSLTTGWIGASL